LVNWKAGQARNGSKLLRCCIQLVTLLWLVAAVAAVVILAHVQAGAVQEVY
jgi:hypothetical protein